jgi:squalene-associated FAD-dependent desaturase
MPDVIIGGGVAGIAAALRLADAGREVTLVESRPRLGGAACSFPREGLRVDNGQHVFLRCCTEYRAFLDRIGATELTSMQPHLDIPVLAPDGRRAALRRTPRVPAPLHLGAALTRYGLLSWPDRLRAGRAVLALLRTDPADPRVDAQSFGAFLRAHGQSDAAIERLWAIVGTATLNAVPDDASLALAAKVFRTGLLTHADAADVGYATAPLGELHHTAARRALAAAGVEVLLRHRVRTARPGRVVVQTSRGEREFSADGIVLAVPPPALTIAPDLPDRGYERLGGSPIVNVHVIYDRAVTDLPFAAAVGSPVQWVFDRTEPSGIRGRAPNAQYVAVTVSAADDLVDVPAREVVARFTAALGELLPAAARANVLDAFVTRERRATFRQAPGTAAYRPGPDSGVPGIALAGAWSATGWPDTMESAARSGNRAAQFLLTGANAADWRDISHQSADNAPVNLGERVTSRGQG